MSLKFQTHDPCFYREIRGFQFYEITTPKTEGFETAVYTFDIPAYGRQFGDNACKFYDEMADSWLFWHFGRTECVGRNDEEFSYQRDLSPWVLHRQRPFAFSD